MSRRLILTATLAATVVLGSLLPLSAQEPDAIAARQATMKTMGGGAKIIGTMLKGEAPFDAVIANTALAIMAAAAAPYGTFFPEGSDMGDTKALPVIWTDRAGFEEKLTGLKTALGAAVEAAPQDIDALKLAFGEVGKNCGACHSTYRAK